MTTVPSILDLDRVLDATASGGQTQFNITWPVIADSETAAVNDLVVRVAGVTIASASVSFSGTPVSGLSGIWNGGTVTIPACTAGQRVVIYSKRDPRRTGSFLEGRSLALTELDKLMDDVAVMMRDLQLTQERSLQISIENMLDGITPDVAATAAAAAASASAAAASVTSAASVLTLIQNYGTPYASLRNIWELFTTSEIAIIRAGENATDLTTKVQTAMTANPDTAWFWPQGWYWFNNTLSLPRGIRWVGAGRGKTNIKMGGAPWAIEQLNINGVETVQGFKAVDITFLPSNHGIRWNSATGGYDDTLATQRYIEDWGLENCEVHFNSATAGQIGVQFNKCFNGGIRGCKFTGFSVQIYGRGSDLNWIEHNRMDNATSTAVEILSVGSFGSTNKVDHNDINNPRDYFYYGSDRDGIFTNNHCELDGNPQSTLGSLIGGIPGKQYASIRIVAGNNFKTLIANNRMEVDQYADRWLLFESGGNPYSLVVEGNGSTGPGFPAYADIPSLPYWTNSSTRLVCSHRNNLYLDSDIRFPMNYEDGAIPGPGVYLVQLTASRPGVTLTGIGSALMCSSGAFKLAANADTSKYIEFSNWNSCGMPANTIKGSIALNIMTFADVAGQVLNWETRDNGGAVISSGTIAHAVANQYYETDVPAFAIATKLQIRVWNADTGHGGNVYVQSVGVRLG